LFIIYVNQKPTYQVLAEWELQDLVRFRPVGKDILHQCNTAMPWLADALLRQLAPLPDPLVTLLILELPGIISQQARYFDAEESLLVEFGLCSIQGI